MKLKSIVYSLTVALLASTCLTFTGCTDDLEAALPYITIAVQTGTAIALKKQGASTRNDVYNISAALRALSSGQLPTVAALNNAIAIYTTDAGAKAIGTIVANTYAKYYAKLSANGNAKEASDLLEALAQGIENGASQSS